MLARLKGNLLMTSQDEQMPATSLTDAEREELEYLRREKEVREEAEKQRQLQELREEQARREREELEKLRHEQVVEDDPYNPDLAEPMPVMQKVIIGVLALLVVVGGIYIFLNQ